jgi:hypothetical protein
MTNTLHIYAQSQPHSESYIVGNNESLKLLRDAIDKALSDRHGSVNAIYCQDGEQYSVIVINSNRNDLLLPYDDFMFRTSLGIHPYKLLTQDEYRKLMTKE